MKYLLDSDAVIDWFNRQRSVEVLLTTIAADGLAISIITHGEPLEGVIAGRDPDAARRVFRTFLRTVRVLPITPTVSARTAALRVDLRSRRRPVNNRALDLFIAATALSADLTFVTSNERDFTDIVGLRLLNPRRQNGQPEA